MARNMVVYLVKGARIALCGSLLCLATLALAQEAVLPSSAQPGERPVAPDAQPKDVDAAKEKPAPKKAAGKKGKDLTDLPLERLADQPVQTAAPSTASASTAPVAAAAPLSLQQQSSSVSRQESTVGQSPAALFVITPEMIQRSGATYLPDVLRMAPGSDVARIDANKWAVGVRGFNARFNRNLLVQIDGRSVYTPLFAGTYWDVQDLMLDDIERIEVIRGPGASVWGENAVNGIINVTTKSAKDTQGGLLTSGAGFAEPAFTAFRYGGKIADDVYYRVYGKWFEQGTFFDPAGNAHDDWRQGRTGFRFDWDATPCDLVTWQGDFYEGRSGVGVRDKIPDAILGARSFNDQDHVSGENVLFRWNHKLSKDTDWTFQCYFDRTLRNDGLFDYELNTVDLDYQFRFLLTPRNKVICGVEYRLYSDHFTPGATFASATNPFTIDVNPRQLTFGVPSTFVQDDITLVEERLHLIAGTKLSYNDFSGLEVQPTCRLLWTPNKQSSAWAAVSRAVRTPSRLDPSINIVSPGPPGGPFPKSLGNPAFDSEVLMAYEAGYRAQVTDKFSFDLALFYNVYNGIQVTAPLPPTGGPPPAPIFNTSIRQNGENAETYGVELAATYKLTDWWRVYGQYTFLDMELHANPSLPAATRKAAEAVEGQSPRNQVYLQSSWDLSKELQFDLIGRYVDNLPTLFATGTPFVHNYISLDARLGWKASPNLEFTVVGQNLLQSHHREFLESNAAGTEIPRGVYGQVTLRW